MTKERDYFFDNIKAVLIFLVVLGHFLLPIHEAGNVLVLIKRLIYVFHMPLFVFVSGYFSKRIYKDGKYNFEKILYLIKAYILFVVAIQAVYAISGFRSFREIDFFSQSGAPWYLFAMIAWYLMIPLIRKFKPLPVITVNIVLALAAGFFKNVGDFLCLSRILVFGPFFFLGYYMEQPVLEKALHPEYKKIVTIAGVSICAGILLTGFKMNDELGMVYENISYYGLDRLWEGPFVRFSLMLAAFVISWAILFYIPREKTTISFIGQHTMPIYMLHRILRDVLMFAGIYDYLGDWGWFALFVLICLSISVIYLLANRHVVNSVNRILKLHMKRI